MTDLNNRRKRQGKVTRLSGMHVKRTPWLLLFAVSPIGVAFAVQASAQEPKSKQTEFKSFDEAFDRLDRGIQTMFFDTDLAMKEFVKVSDSSGASKTFRRPVTRAGQKNPMTFFTHWDPPGPEWRSGYQDFQAVTDSNVEFGVVFYGNGGKPLSRIAVQRKLVWNSSILGSYDSVRRSVEEIATDALHGNDKGYRSEGKSPNGFQIQVRPILLGREACVNCHTDMNRNEPAALVAYVMREKPRNASR